MKLVEPTSADVNQPSANEFKYQHAVVLGDFNAYIVTLTDRRGDAMEDLIEQLRQFAFNTGAGRYIRRCVLSHLDVTIASDDITYVCNWHVTND